MDGDNLNLIIVGSCRRTYNDCVKIMTRDLNTVLIPNIGIRIRARHIGLDSSLSAFANSVIIIKDGNGRRSRSIKHRNGDGTLCGTSTGLSCGGGGNCISGRGGRSNVHRVGIGVVNAG